MKNSLLNTKPTYTETVATNVGWVDVNSKELIVSVPMLLNRLEDELADINQQIADYGYPTET